MNIINCVCQRLFAHVLWFCLPVLSLRDTVETSLSEGDLAAAAPTTTRRAAASAFVLLLYP